MRVESALFAKNINYEINSIVLEYELTIERTTALLAGTEKKESIEKEQIMQKIKHIKKE
jgi:hypothetical protein